MKFKYTCEPLDTGGYMAKATEYAPLIVYGVTEEEAIDTLRGAFLLYHKYHKDIKKDFIDPKYLEVDVE